MGYVANLEGEQLGDNLYKVFEGKSDEQVVWNGFEQTVILLPVGRTRGYSLMPFGTVGNCMTQMIKGDLFAKDNWKKMGFSGVAVESETKVVHKVKVDDFIKKHGLSEDARDSIMV